MFETIENLRNVKREHVESLLNWPNVTAVDINYKTVRGEKTDKLCLVIWVKKKEEESRIRQEDILPKTLDGFTVDVVEGKATLGEGYNWPSTTKTDKQESDEDGAGGEQHSSVTTSEDISLCRGGGGKLRRLDTLKGGDSLAPNGASFTGTLGYFVIKNGVVGILSNFHVMGGERTKLISPGREDGGTSVDYIGTVKNSVLTTDVDCGYAPLRGRIESFLLKDERSIKGTEAAAVGTHIKFYGRTSGLVNTGLVSSVDWSGNVNGKIFHNQIHISVEVRPGDSGSILINKVNNTAIGLNFAGGDGFGIANDIGAVLNALDVKLALN